jgi:hypothetical protein
MAGRASVNDDPRCGIFDVQGLVHQEFIPEERTVNKETYAEISRHFRDAV